MLGCVVSTFLYKYMMMMMMMMIYDWSVVSLKKGHLLVSITAYLEVSVCLFRRGLAALLNKRSTAAEDGSAVLYRIDTSLADGNNVKGQWNYNMLVKCCRSHVG